MKEVAISSDGGPFSGTGNTFSVHAWSGSGPPFLHVHHADDEAWHVLEGKIRFRFLDREVEVSAGSTVFVPAGVPHAYATEDARYLIILTPRLESLIAELHNAPPEDQPEIYRRHESELLE